MAKFGYPVRVTGMVRQFHDGMLARLQIDREYSLQFSVINPEKRISFRSKEIIQMANISESVLLSLFMRATEKSNISHAPSAGLSSNGLGGVRDVTTLNAVFPNDLFSDHLYIQNKQA